MIVWGGGITPKNSGGVYDPTTDTWTATSTGTNCPSVRYNLEDCVVWTGDQMFVWGGAGLLDARGDGALYDPTTDTWDAITSVSDPSARDGHTAVWTGSEVIVWGGYHLSGSDWVADNTGGHYDPATDTWTDTQTVGAPQARYKHTAVWTGDEMIVWGGKYQDSSGTSYYLADGYRYFCDPVK